MSRAPDHAPAEQRPERSERSTAPVEAAGEALAREDDEEDMPRAQITRRNMLLFGLFVLSAIAFLYFVLPQITGLDETWRRIESGDPLWLMGALGFTVASFGGYVVMFQAIYQPEGSRIGWRESYQITMAGLAATRLFAAAGAGGLVLTAWAVRRAGMPPRAVADRTIAFLVITYAVYMAAVIVCGFGLRYGLFEGSAPFSVTTVPASLALVAVLIALALTFVPVDFERRLGTLSCREDWVGRWARRLATVPATASAGVRLAIEHLRRRDGAFPGAIMYWGFNIAVLWASFHAFGKPPPPAVLIQGYFVGMLGNLLPLPGGIGGVDGGMIGAFALFGVDTGLAVVAVLTYRAFAFWLPTIPGAIAYFQLRKTVARWREERRGALPDAAPA